MADPADGGARFEGLVRPWFFPFLGLTAAVAVGIFYTTGLLSESGAGGVVAVVVPLVLGLLVARPALDRATPPVARLLLGVAGLLAFAGAAVPALEAVRPGEPAFVAELDAASPAAALPPGVDGRVMALVSTKLAGSAEPSVAFRVTGFDPPVEGRLERTFSTARVGRGGSARIARDHDSDWFEARIPAGAREIRLERVQGLAATPLRVAIHRVWLPHAVAWIVALLVVVLAAAGEVLAGADHGSAIAAGVAVAFGLIVGYNVTPARAVTPSLWAIVLGAIAGAPVAVALRLVARRVLAGASPAGKGGKARPRA